MSKLRKCGCTSDEIAFILNSPEIVEMGAQEKLDHLCALLATFYAKYARMSEPQQAKDQVVKYNIEALKWIIRVLRRQRGFITPE